MKRPIDRDEKFPPSALPNGRGRAPEDSPFDMAELEPESKELDPQALADTPMGAPPPEEPIAKDPQTVTWVRPRPVQQESNIRAWMVFLAGLFLLVALWVPVRAIYQRIRYRPVAMGVRDADTFIALAYGGVSAGTVRGPEEVSRAQFEQHIRALRQRGYNPIGLSDVRAFYEDGQLLPRRAVLITMEQGRRNSYLETRAILQSERWKAVMFVRGDTIRQNDPSALRWPILRDMARSGVWEIGAQSFGGFRRIPAGPEGETGNFFASPMWIATEQRLETPEEFKNRVRAEHERMVAEFQEGMGEAPVAFAFPYGDYGQYDPRAVPVRVFNLAEVDRHYAIGFSLGPFLLNTRYTDPRALNRLLVNPDWGPEQLIDILESGRAVQPWHLTNPLAPARWMTDWGLVKHPEDGSFWITAIPADSDPKAHPPTTGALTWMVGSDLFGDLVFRMRFRVEAGQFGIRMRARPGGEEGIRILFDDTGNVWVKQKLYGAEEFTQATARHLGTRPGGEQELKLSLKDRTLFATLNGNMLLQEPLDLMGEGLPGLFGFEVWDRTPGVAATQILELDFPRPGRVLLSWSSREHVPMALLIRQLHDQAHRLAAVSPPWLDAMSSIPLVLPQWDDETVRTFARMRSILVLPRITLRNAELALQIPPELPASEARAMSVDGIFFDCHQVPQDQIHVLVPWLQEVHQRIKDHDMKLAIHFPASVARLASFASIAAMFPGALIAVETPERADELEAVQTEAVVAETLELPPGDMHLSLFYQLAARALSEEALTPQARLEASRRDGYMAYQEGDFDRAIEHWSQWLELDPDNTEALSLIAQAWIQKGDLDEGLDYLTRSLEISPGQINMAIRRAELLDRMGRTDEAREQLNLYARVFPENPDILIAQSQWLRRRHRRLEARAMVETLVREAPLNLTARIALLNLLDNPGERYRTMLGILDLGRSPDSQIPFGQSLLNYEILTFPESAALFGYIRDQADRGQSTRQRELYESFLPLTNRITDDFSSGQLSDGWIASGGIRGLSQGRYELRAAIDQAETYLRLRRSELMRDGVLEVILDETQGFFWIYARRSSRAMVRFGFDLDGFIHLQAWREGDLVANATRPWIRPPGSMTMRLEVRGDGIRGFVNGLEIFDGPVEIPSDVAYGWWGIAPFAFDLGIARASIIRMDCEPDPTQLVLVPPGDPSRQVVALRPHAGSISALVPAWFFQNPDGTLPTALPDDAGTLRMFTAFHRIRLMPGVDLSYDGDVDPVRVVDLIRRHRLPGVVLKRRTPPKQPWLDALSAALEDHPATVLVLASEAALWNVPRAGEESRGELVVRPEVRDHLLPGPGEQILLREMPFGSVLIPPLQEEWKVYLWHSQTTEKEDDEDWVTPRLYLLESDGTLAMPAAR